MGGNCYEAALETLAALPTSLRSIATVCHGTPLGDGGDAEGKRFGHAWVELGGAVLDGSNGRSIALPRAVYYAAGHIDPDEVRRYSATAATDRMMTFGTSGPWHVTDHTAVAHTVDPDSIPDCSDCRIGHTPGRCRDVQRLLGHTEPFGPATHPEGR